MPDPGLDDVMAAIRIAARRFDAGGGRLLSDVLWTRSAPFRIGEIAATLRTATTPGAGFVLLLGQVVTRRAVLFRHTSPFVVEDEIGGDLDLPGPYAVLLLCGVDPVGMAIGLNGYAQAVAAARNFLPVTSTLDRDVLAILGRLRDRLDAHGADCTISRTLDPDAGVGAELRLEVARRGLPDLTLHVRLAAAGAPIEDPLGFSVSGREIADGSFVAWLERRLLSHA